MITGGEGIGGKGIRFHCCRICLVITGGDWVQSPELFAGFDKVFDCFAACFVCVGCKLW